MLGDDDLASGGETAGGDAGRLHQGLPIAAGGFVFAAGIAADQLGCFGGADGFGFVSVRGAFGEQIEDGGFEGGVLFAGAIAAAGFAAEFNDVPVLLPLLLPLNRTAAGLAELVFMRGGTVGFGFAVGHNSERQPKIFKDHLTSRVFFQLLLFVVTDSRYHQQIEIISLQDLDPPFP